MHPARDGFGDSENIRLGIEVSGGKPGFPGRRFGKVPLGGMNVSQPFAKSFRRRCCSFDRFCGRRSAHARWRRKIEAIRASFRKLLGIEPLELAAVH
jgi:hypothetical protein